VGRREHAERRREELIDAALATFASKGVDGASVKDVAEAASVTPGLLYHYFSSKEALIAVVLNERGFTPQLRDLLTEHQDEPAFVVLPKLVREFDQMLAANADLVSLFFSASHAHAALRDLVFTGETLLHSYLTSRAEAGEIRPELTRVAAETVFAAVAMGHKTGARIDPHQLVKLILNGL
jgi:TetR/AcrR family transcriptional regulator, cholesterol catabolism regulator